MKDANLGNRPNGSRCETRGRKARPHVLLGMYAENGGIDVADRFLSAAEKTLKVLATQPESGSSFFVRKPGLRGMRRVPVSDGFEKILLFYFPIKSGIELIRVVHGSRDLEKLLAEGFFG